MAIPSSFSQGILQPSIVLILIKYVNVMYGERGSPSDEGDIGGLSDHTEVRSIQK